MELEKYSGKLCLIFHNFENKGDALASILYLLKVVLQINLNPSSIAACHPLNQNLNAPIIVKFIYHQDRDLVWRRRTWLKGISNSMGRAVQTEECLAPRDREIKSEAKQLGLLAYTRRPDVFVYNQNHPNADAIQVKKTAELKDYVAIKNSKQDYIPTKPAQVQLTNHIETPKQPPTLTRKPSTWLPHSAKRKRFQLSPALESEDTASLANDIVQSLVPALVQAIKEANKPFGKCSTEVITNTNDKNCSFRSYRNI